MVFYYLKQMEKHLKTRVQYWAGNRLGATVGGVAAYHMRPADQLAEPWPGGPIQPRRRPAARKRGAHAGHTHDVVTTRRRGSVAGLRTPADKES
jgi:hypothetical protein